MSPELENYLTQSYRRDVMGDAVQVDVPTYSPELMTEIDTEVANIDQLRLGAHLANRDFAAYQHRRALTRLKLLFEGVQNATASLKEPKRLSDEREDADGGGGQEPARPEPEAGSSDSL